MAIPPIIYQTYAHADLPKVTRFFVRLMQMRNPGYAYEFYDDRRVLSFFRESYGKDVTQLYERLAIGAAKADFFRYAVLYKYGGVYLDIDGYCVKKLDDMIRADDEAIISKERHPGIYVQWALVYDKGHPILERVLELVMDNIAHDRYPYDVHQMTGPSAYSMAIEQCIASGKAGRYRIFGTDYEGYFKDKHPFNKRIYAKGQHWRQQQQKRPVLWEK